LSVRQALDAPDKVIAVMRDHRELVAADSSSQVESTDDDAVERIAKDPLSRHKGLATSVPASESIDSHKPVAVATNTTIASKGQESTNVDTKSSFLKSSGSSGASFQVFTDDSSTQVVSNATTSKTISSSAPVKMSSLGHTVSSTLPAAKSNKPFSIFHDTENNNAPGTVHRSSSSISISAGHSSSAPFQIFTEEETPAQAPVRSIPATVAMSTTSKTPSRVLSPSTAVQVESNTTSDTADDKQIQDLLNELGILDSEDGTINTRLARRDIDSLFTSDSPESSFLNHQAAESSSMQERYNSNSSPKPLPIPSYAGGAFPSKSDAKVSSLGLGLFGGNDLSIIEEVSVMSLIMIIVV